jgi:hypothetical protein
LRNYTKGREQSEREVVLSSRQSEGEISQEPQEHDKDNEADAPRLPPGKIWQTLLAASSNAVLTLIS